MQPIYVLRTTARIRRHVRVTARRTKRDWAECIRELIDVHYPEATRIRLVLDNLNTHTGASLYEAFPPKEARRLLDRLEIHHTPKHASWLNMAEIEIGVLQSQCLNRRLDNADWLRRWNPCLGRTTQQTTGQNPLEFYHRRRPA